jgi:hypothetical protein
MSQQSKTYFRQGKYHARLEVARRVPAKSTTEQVELVWKLLGHYGTDGVLYAVEEPRYPPSTFLSLTEATVGTEGNPGWVAETLAFLGFDGNFDNLGAIAGWEGSITNTHKPNHENVLRDSWGVLRPAKPREVEPPDQKVLRQLTARFGGVFKRLAKGDPKGTPAAPPRPAAPAHQPAPAAPIPAELNGDLPPGPEEFGTPGDNSDIPF